MKKTKIIAIVVPIVAFISVGVFYFIMMPREVWAFNAFDQADRLPPQSLNFIQERYPNVLVLDVELDWDGYEAYLANGVTIDFRFSGSARSIDIDSDDYYSRNPISDTWAPNSSSENTFVFETPLTSLSEYMIDYLAERFPEAHVIRTERDYDGIEVYLSNGFRVDFDNDGTVEVEYQDE
jgi:hypothetical protein